MKIAEITIDNNEKIKVLYADKIDETNKHYRCFCEIASILNFSAETEKAIKFKEIQSWLPKSQVRIYQNRLFVKIFLALENNLSICSGPIYVKDAPYIEKLGELEVVRGDISSSLYDLKGKYFQLPNYAIYNNICYYNQGGKVESVGASSSITLTPLINGHFKSVLIPTSQVVANDFGIFIPAWLAQTNHLVSLYNYDKRYFADNVDIENMLGYHNTKEFSLFTKLANILIFKNYCPALNAIKQKNVA